VTSRPCSTTRRLYTEVARLPRRLGPAGIASPTTAALAVLDPDVVLRSDIRPPLRGAAAVAGGALMFRHAGVSVTPVLVNGAAGIPSRTLDGRLLAVMSFTVARGRIVEIDVLGNPARLRRLGLASKDSA
jgi:RNA polymerase sigma-70 factor (ECF subfamily)